MPRDRSPATSPLAGANVRAGKILAGKYRVERVIGQGGMGLVVAAKHLHLGEQVAIKLLRPGVRPRSDAFERFVREGRTAARMRNEHVARVHDAGILDSGEPYLVLEYLEGVDLRTLLRKRGPLPVETAVVYLLQVCEAVAEAHSLGIVHRDLKPGNLFVTRRADGSESVKVIDFGISKIVSPPVEHGEETPLTENDGAIGTPAYMAPEQMRSARTADARADIWSLGAVLYGLLIGSSPFAGETMVAVYDGILKGAPSPRAARPEIPAALEEVVLRCLRVDPAERYQDAGQLAEALAEHAPPTARIHAERAARIARGRPSSADGPGGDDPAAPGPGPTTEAAEPLSDAPQGTAPAYTETSAEPSAPAAQTTTEITREPSWVRSAASLPAPLVPRSASAGARPRAWLDGRSRLLAALGLALATGGAVGWYARRGASEGEARPPVSASTPQDPREAAPSAAPPPPAVPQALPVPSAAASASALPGPIHPPQRPPQGGRRLAAPRTPLVSSVTMQAPTAVPSARPVPGLAETPD